MDTSPRTLEELLEYTPPAGMRTFIPVSFEGGIAAAIAARQAVIENKALESNAEQGIVRLYDPIGGSFGMTAKKFAALVDKQQGDFTLAINSQGGALFEGMAMSNTLRRYDRGKISAEVDGVAASAATIVAMGADSIAATPETRYLIHQVQLMATGNAEDIEGFLREARALDDALARMYAIKSKGTLDEKKALALMKEDKFLSAEEALGNGLIDRVIDPEPADGKEVTASVKRVAHMRRVFDAFGHNLLMEESK